MKRFITSANMSLFKLLYGLCVCTEDNQQTMFRASGLSTVQTLKLYNNLLIAPAGICTLCIARYLLLKFGIYWTCAIIVLVI